jgi:AraC family transcriptional activator of pobA
MKQIPVYSLHDFKLNSDPDTLFQVEVFDANRHFKVSYPHRHDFYEILYLTHGSGFHIIDEHKYKISPPCVFFLTPGQAHKLELSNDIAGFIFLFNGEFYLGNNQNKNRLLEYPFFFSVLQENPPLILHDVNDRDFLRNLFVEGCREMESKSCSSELVRSILETILLICDKIYPKELRSVQKGKGHILVKNFLKLLEENFHQNYRINDYAGKLSVTPNHLTQTVKRITGRNSVSLIQEKTMAEIKRLLVHSNMTVSEIADFLNFPDQSYFAKYFKKFAGVSPSEFRKVNLSN